MFKALDRYDPARPFPAWLLTIAARLSIDHLRRRRVKTQPLVRSEPGSQEERVVEVEDPGFGPDELLERRGGGGRGRSAHRGAARALPHRRGAASPAGSLVRGDRRGAAPAAGHGEGPDPPGAGAAEGPAGEWIMTRCEQEAASRTSSTASCRPARPWPSARTWRPARGARRRSSPTGASSPRSSASRSRSRGRELTGRILAHVLPSRVRRRRLAALGLGYAAGLVVTGAGAALWMFGAGGSVALQALPAWLWRHRAAGRAGRARRARRVGREPGHRLGLARGGRPGAWRR